MVDIKLDDMWRLTGAANGDAPIVSNAECLLQDIKLEALTQEGELFYDEEYGWSLMDFLHCENDELALIEIKNRVRQKISKREEIEQESIQTVVVFTTEAIRIHASFKLIGNNNTLTLEISLERINVEVEE